jgi:Sin-like protein conserved region.
MDSPHFQQISRNAPTLSQHSTSCISSCQSIMDASSPPTQSQSVTTKTTITATAPLQSAALSNVKDDETNPMQIEETTYSSHHHGGEHGVNLPGGERGVTVSNHMSIDDPTLLSALLEDNDQDANVYNDNMELDNILSEEDDEIIREIDVYISPELAKTMYLIQFPLQPASHAIHPLESKIEKSGNHGKRPVMKKSSAPPVPKAAKIKPQHSLLELTYNVPSHSFSSQRQIPGPLNLTERTFASQNIPIKTHMALGLFDSTGNKIDLVPLNSIIQMRPTFRHVDALFDEGSAAGDGGAEEGDGEVNGNKERHRNQSCFKNRKMNARYWLENHPMPTRRQAKKQKNGLTWTFMDPAVRKGKLS